MKKILLVSLFILNLLPNMNERGIITIGRNCLYAQQQANEYANDGYECDYGWSPLPCDWDDPCITACSLCAWSGPCSEMGGHYCSYSPYTENYNPLIPGHHDDNGSDDGGYSGYEGGGGGGGNTSTTFNDGSVTYSIADSLQMMQNDRRKTHDLIVPKGSRTTMETRKLAMKFMVIRSKYTEKEVAAVYLGNGDVVIFHDKESTYRSCRYYTTPGTENGIYKEFYIHNNNSYEVKGYVHTHPYFSLSSNANNPLYISYEDEQNARTYSGDINILLLDGNYYSQGTEGNSLYSPNWKFNIYDN